MDDLPAMSSPIITHIPGRRHPGNPGGLPRLLLVDGVRGAHQIRQDALPTFPPVGLLQPPPDSGMPALEWLPSGATVTQYCMYYRHGTVEPNRPQIHDTVTPQIPPVTNALPALSVSGVQVQPPPFAIPVVLPVFPNIFTATSSALSPWNGQSHVSN